MDEGIAARGEAETLAQSFGKNIGHARINHLHCGIHGAANGARAERADGFVNGNDAADFGGVRLTVTKHFELRIDHFEARGAELIDFGFAVKDELLAGFEAAFEIAAVKKFAREEAAGGVLHEKMVDGVVGEFVGDGLAAHDARADRVDAVGLDVFYVGEMDAVFVAEGEIGEEILEGVDAALGEEFGALRADAFDHANFGGEAESHEHFFISFPGERNGVADCERSRANVAGEQWRASRGGKLAAELPHTKNPKMACPLPRILHKCSF